MEHVIGVLSLLWIYYLVRVGITTRNMPATWWVERNTE